MKREDYISDDLVVKRAKAAVAIELEKKRALDIPAVVYDADTKLIYHVYSDGKKIEIGKRMREGRYSERVNKKT